MSQPSNNPRGRIGPDNPIPDDAQRVFDTVTGPNLRLGDNLIQLAVIVAGTVLGAVVGLVIAATQGSLREPLGYMIVSAFGGLVLSLLLSGAVLGIIRGVGATKRP